MKSLGILQYSLQHEKDYVFKLSEAGIALGFDVYRFIPNQLSSHHLRGVTYSQIQKDWVEIDFPVPNFIYDRCFHNGNCTAKETAFIKWLKTKADTTFLGHGLPGKWEIHKHLKKNALLNRHLPQSIKLQPHTCAKVLADMLIEHDKLILKPSIGSQGNGLMLITKNLHKIGVQINHNGHILHHTYDNTGSLLKMIRSVLKERDYIAQQWLSLLDQKDRPFDRRVVMKKTSYATWEEIGRATRVGNAESFVSNLHSGGSIQTDQQLLIPEGVFHQAEQKISRLSHCVASLLEKDFPPLFELGLDFGIDRTGKVWLLEANSKPGHKAIRSHRNYDAIPFHYCQSLISEKKGVNCYEHDSSIKKG
ncbi:YheC/YheD family protein [Pseudalkalibacillus hwajinpoensis]|uniref:YheC/YheD family endospore coat-associated protein n=1 Tax=Guptibacillus hwajinpoensis TaxID=208199 RepID=UPI001CFE6021|nr:YheC/YheD family protein [Pseudalkalibacillus hwajinpoensis]